MKLEKELYTIEEVANLLGLTERTIRKYVAEGTLKSVNIVRNVRITKEALEDIIVRNDKEVI